MHLVRSVLALVVVFSLAACAAIYRTPGAESRTQNELAVLEFNGNKAYGVNPVGVDGKHRGFGFISRYELTPGDHTMNIALNIGLGVSSKTITLAFRVDADRTYELKYEISSTGYKQGKWRVWIEEKATGKSISSVAG